MVQSVNPARGTQPVSARGADRRDGDSARPPASGTDRLDSTPETVAIAKGDTIGAIAARYGVSIDGLRQLNPEIFQDGQDARGRKRSADGRWVYPGDVIRLRTAGTPTPSPAQPAVTSDRVVAAAKAFIDAAGNTADPGAAAQAQDMLNLIPATDPDRGAYEAKVKAITGRVPVVAPATDGSADLAIASEGFNAASGAFDRASDAAGKAAARTQAILSYQQAARAVASMPPGEERQVATSQLEMMETRLKGMGATDAAIATARQAGGLPSVVQTPAGAVPAVPGGVPGATPTSPATQPIDPAAQDAFMAAQARFDEASESYDRALGGAKSLADAAAAIQGAQQKALAAYNEALAAGSRVGPSAQPALDAMAERLLQMGVSRKILDEARAKAPAMQEGKGGAATSPNGTPLPVGPLPQGQQPIGPQAQPSAQAPLPTPQALTDQFGMQRQLFLKAIEDYVNASTNGDQAGAEQARARAKAAYTEAAKLVGQMDANTKPSYNKLLDDFEDKLQYYKVASIAEMDPVRKAAKLTPSASTAWAPDNQKPGSPVPEVSKIRPSSQPADSQAQAAQSDEPKNEDERKLRTQLAQMLPKMNAGQVAKLPYESVKGASNDQRGYMLKELLDHWWVGGDKKKYAADIIEIASGEGKLDMTLRSFDQQMNGGGIKKLFSKLKGEDEIRTAKNIFWDLKDINRPGADLLLAVANEMDKDAIRAVLTAYGHSSQSDWFKRVPPEVKAVWAKKLDSGWFGKSSQDAAMIQALQAGANAR